MMINAHDNLLAMFQAGLDSVSGKMAVKKALSTGNYNKFSHFIAIGKASEAMLSGIPDNKITSALLISKHGHISDESYKNNKFECIESDHPIPKISSIKAGQSLIQYLNKLPEEEPVLFLISGGTSALVEVLREGWDLEQLQALTDYLLSNAYSIDQINEVRRQISKIKGGGLWSYINKRVVSCLMISDVPNDDPAVIGSGLLFSSEKSSLPGSFKNLPKEWSKKLGHYSPNKIPVSFNWKIIASLGDAKNSAASKAESLGYLVKIMPDFLQGDAREEAESCIRILKENKNTVCIWGGETTVLLPKNAGKGGRNQHLALSAAIAIDGCKNTHLLSAGTDGSDGMTTATGAIVDGFTVSQGRKANLIAEDYLVRADSNSFFDATDSLIITGVTGTNVMDLVIGIHHQT